MERNYSDRMSRLSSSVVRDTMKYLRLPGILSLSAGSPAAESLPAEEIRQITAELFERKPLEVLQYGETIGHMPLREAYLEHIVRPKGIQAEIENTLIITGSAQGIFLAIDAFVDAGDVILVENPTFLNVLNLLRKINAVIIPVETDDHGIVIEDLEQKVREYHPKLLYTIPTFQNPSGRTIPADRRKKIAELAAEYSFVVLEDDPYAEIRVSGESVPPIKYYDEAGQVILLNSFSKIIAPGIRVGAIMAPPDIIHTLESIKQGVDTHTPILNQAICAEYLNRGLLPEHLVKANAIYRERLQAMLEGLKEALPEGSEYTVPEGGFFIWIKLPGDIDSAQLLMTGIEKYKILYLPGSPFCVDPKDGANYIRLNFSSCGPDKIREAVKRLGLMLADYYRNR